MSEQNTEFDINQPFVTQEQKFKYWEESKTEIKRLKAALAEIEKCEPVAWMTKRGDVIEQFGTMAITNAHKNSLVLAEQIIADLFDIPLYTSPISKEWVGLSNVRIEELFSKTDSSFSFAKAISDELKQLNAPKE